MKKVFSKTQNYMKKKYISSIVITAILFVVMIFGISCEKTIEIDLEDAKIRIVVNSEINPDSTIKVNVTRSRHILDNADIVPLGDADVKLFEDDVLIGTLVYQSHGNYYINYKPKIGKTYKVTVAHPNFDDVYGTTFIPEIVEFTSIDTSKAYDEYGNTRIVFNVKFNDPAGEKNYYMISMRNKYRYEIWDENLMVYDTLYVGPDTTIVHIDYGGYRWVETTDKLWFNSEDMIIDAFVYQRNAAVFGDELIDGKQYTIKLSADQYSFYSDTNMVYIDFYSISPEYYKYMVSFLKHQDASGDPFAEPVIVFSNIVEGIGIFASSNIYTDSLQIISNNGGYFEY
jgi:hypothetical protein